VRLWETSSGAGRITLAVCGADLWDVALDGAGRLLATGGAEGLIHLWAADSGRPVATLSGHRGGIRGLALSEDGQLLVSSGGDETVRLWDTRTGRCLRTLRPDRLYERMDISGLTGVTAAQRTTLVMLGAVDRAPAPDQPGT
jgi:WD40 repeat protein